MFTLLILNTLFTQKVWAEERIVDIPLSEQVTRTVIAYKPFMMCGDRQSLIGFNTLDPETLFEKCQMVSMQTSDAFLLEITYQVQAEATYQVREQVYSFYVATIVSIRNLAGEVEQSDELNRDFALHPKWVFVRKSNQGAS